jgi:hypothetical protein
MPRFAFALALFAAALPIGASAAQSWEDVSAQTALRALDSAPLVSGPARVATGTLSIRPDAAAPKLIANFVAAGFAQTGVPCFACVNGAQTSFNVGLSGPYNYVTKNTVYQYTLSFTDLSLPNPTNCKVAWAITAGAKKIDSFSANVTVTTPGSTWLYGLDRNPPSPAYHGGALLTGKVTCGTSSGTTKAVLYFQ